MIDHLSYSSISTWQHCPRAWWVGYVMGIREPSSPAQVLGTIVHKVIEDIVVTKNFGEIERIARESAVESIADAVKTGTASVSVDVDDMVHTVLDILNDPCIISIIEDIEVNDGSDIERRVSFNVEGVPIPCNRVH